MASKTPPIPLTTPALNLNSPLKSQGSDIVTFKPFIPGSSQPLPRGRFKRNKFVPNQKLVKEGKREILPGIFEPEYYNQFLSLKLDGEKRVKDLDIFKVHRDIVSICGKEPKMTPQSDGGLLIEVPSLEESEKIQKLMAVDGVEAICTPHRTLNQCKGVISCFDLLKYSEERILEELKSQKVSAVKRIIKKENGIEVPTPTLILTFELLKAPEIIRAAWHRLKVRPFIPKVKRCFYCQKYGHVNNTCRRKEKGEPEICVNCGREQHGECNNHPSCVNCGGDHAASSKSCDRYVLEQEIMNLRSIEHISFAEAKEAILSRNIRPGVSFASVLRNKKSKNSEPLAPSPRQPRNNGPLNPGAIKKRRLSNENGEQRTNKFQLTTPTEITFADVNPFSVLEDEADLNNTEPSQMDSAIEESVNSLEGTSNNISDQPLVGDNPFSLACSLEQPSVDASSCSMEHSEAPLSTDSGEPVDPNILPDPCGEGKINPTTLEVLTDVETYKNKIKSNQTTPIPSLKKGEILKKLPSPVGTREVSMLRKLKVPNIDKKVNTIPSKNVKSSGMAFDKGTFKPKN